MNIITSIIYEVHMKGYNFQHRNHLTTKKEDVTFISRSEAKKFAKDRMKYYTSIFYPPLFRAVSYRIVKRCYVQFSF